MASKLAAALWRETNKFEVYDFDRSTGKVSNPRSFGPFAEAYGVEFSPDGTKVYGTCNGVGGGETQIWQFDLKTKAKTLVGGQVGQPQNWRPAARPRRPHLRGPRRQPQPGRHSKTPTPWAKTASTLTKA